MRNYVSFCLMGVLLFGLSAVIAQAPPSAPGYHWHYFPGDASQIALYTRGVQIGNLNVETGDYFRHLPMGGFEDEPSEPPIAPPDGITGPFRCGCSKECACFKKKCGCRDGKRCNKDCKCQRVIGGGDAGHVEPDGTMNYGLVLEKIQQSPDHIVNGKEATKEQVLEAIRTGQLDAQKPTLPDDAKWLCVTVIGPDEFTRPILNDFATNPALAPFKDKIKVKGYAPDHWAVRDTGFVSPSIYYQAADGKVLYRWDAYAGAEKTAEELRHRDPNYQPDNDPRPNQPKPNAPGGETDLGMILGMIGAGVGGFGCFTILVVFCIFGLILLVRHARAS